jgi:putative DNA primase/helicase
MDIWFEMKELAELGYPVIPICPGNHDGVSEWHKEKCTSPGKAPLVIEWNKRRYTTEEEITEWEEEFPNANLGLVLGCVSGLVGVDVDGEFGFERLKHFSNGDIEDTWQFTTPGGGMRYIFRIPEGVSIKKKKIDDKTKEHSELAILGNGSNTVMPPSCHVNGGRYLWVYGHAPWDIEPAIAPDWLLELVEAKVVVEKPRPAGKRNEFSDASSVLNSLLSKCKVFEAAAQGHIGGSECNSFPFLAALVAAEENEAAKEFAGIVQEYDKRADERLEELLKGAKAYPTKCTTLGCSEGDIKLCLGNVKYSKRGNVANKPVQHLKKEQGADLEAAGFILNAEGNITGVNGNKFAKMVLKRHVLLYTDGGRFYIYRDGVYEAIDANNLSRLLRDIVHEYQENAWNPRLESAYIEALKRETPRVDKLDADRNFLNFENGMLNIHNGKLSHHSPKYHSCIRIPIEFNPEAEAVLFKKFLGEVFMEDDSLIQLVAEIMGYCLTGETRAQKAFMFYGHGANGKSVLAAVIRALVGKENVASVPLRELQNSFARLDLVDKTVNLVTEAEFDSKGMATEIFKAMVSGDVIRVEIKNGASFSYAPMAKFISCHNNLPYSRDHRHGLIRRLIILPFRRQFTEEEQDLDLLDKLLEELPGIMNFALEGLQCLQKNNYKFTKCVAVQELLEDFTKNINPMVAFVDECISINGNNRLFNGDAWEAFKEWCRQNGHKTSAEITRQRFMAEFKAVLEEKHVPFAAGKRGDRYLSGICLDLQKLNDDERKDGADVELQYKMAPFYEGKLKRRKPKEVHIDID